MTKIYKRYGESFYVAYSLVRIDRALGYKKLENISFIGVRFIQNVSQSGSMRLALTVSPTSCQLPKLSHHTPLPTVLHMVWLKWEGKLGSVICLFGWIMVWLLYKS